ncbi:MAG TPA: MBL fold metallo-hydrolase, partial [Phototrophicaceae bacterium]|nr:MBL fold metallo-hydrolase [Phototrophicaceae bacterium]
SFYRYKLGSLELTAIYDGYWHRPIDSRFVRNAPYREVTRALADAFMPPKKLSMPFTPLLIDTGSKRVLIDTGSGGQIAPTAGTLTANLTAAGFEAKSIDTILISNFHPDHIDGLKTKDNGLVFPNAEVLVPEAEWAFWMDDANLDKAQSDMIKLFFRNARRIFGDMGSRVKRFVPGREVAPGITAVAAPGHTPGHVAYAIASGGHTMMALCDTTNHPWLFARHPDWSPVIDMNGPQAVRTRKRILDRVAADKMLIQGYHFPFPACGHIIKTRTGYDFVPSLWEAMM